MTGKPPGTQMGRPSGYNPEYAAQATKLCELGATDIELADFFGVSDRTIYRWQNKYPEFCHALKVGKEAADARIERALYHKAAGYSFDAEKIHVMKDGEVVRVPYREHIPPDTTAGIFWLKNRKSAEWRDRIVNEHVGKDGGPIETKSDPRDLARAVLAMLREAEIAK